MLASQQRFEDGGENMKHPAFHPEKMYTYLRGYASALGMKDTLKALAFAREKHKDQFRKSGEPYIVHPLTMACNAVSMGIKEDSVKYCCRDDQKKRIKR